MPTRTFMNLPKEKKVRILKAAKKEFSRVPLEKAIIANIVKEARIPRGSFYQYFDSIDDLFVYLINYMYGVDKKKFAHYLEEADNDLYEALKMRFANLIDKLENEENRQFRINTFSTLFNIEHENREEIVNSISKVDTIIDFEFIPNDFETGETSSKVVDLIKMIGLSCTEKFLSKSEDAEETKNNYNKYIDLVKVGFSNVF